MILVGVGVMGVKPTPAAPSPSLETAAATGSRRCAGSRPDQSATPIRFTVLTLTRRRRANPILGQAKTVEMFTEFARRHAGSIGGVVSHQQILGRGLENEPIRCGR